MIDTHWRDVQAIAEVLLEKGTLSGFDVAGILALNARREAHEFWQNAARGFCHARLKIRMPSARKRSVPGGQGLVWRLPGRIAGVGASFADRRLARRISGRGGWVRHSGSESATQRIPYPHESCDIEMA